MTFCSDLSVLVKLPRFARRTMTIAERRLPWRYILATLGFSLVSFLFLELWSEIDEGDARAIDRAVLIGFRNATDTSSMIGPAWMEQVMKDITTLGSPTLLVLAVVAVPHVVDAPFPGTGSRHSPLDLPRKYVEGKHLGVLVPNHVQVATLEGGSRDQLGTAIGETVHARGIEEKDVSPSGRDDEGALGVAECLERGHQWGGALGIPGIR